MFTIFVPMSRPRSIYVVSLIYFSFSSPFSLSLFVKSHENRPTLFFCYFLGCVLLFLDDNVDEEYE